MTMTKKKVFTASIMVLISAILAWVVIVKISTFALKKYPQTLDISEL